MDGDDILFRNFAYYRQIGGGEHRYSVFPQSGKNRAVRGIQEIMTIIHVAEGTPMHARIRLMINKAHTAFAAQRNCQGRTAQNYGSSCQRSATRHSPLNSGEEEREKKKEKERVLLRVYLMYLSTAGGPPTSRWAAALRLLAVGPPAV